MISETFFLLHVKYVSLYFLFVLVFYVNVKYGTDYLIGWQCGNCQAVSWDRRRSNWFIRRFWLFASLQSILRTKYLSLYRTAFFVEINYEFVYSVDLRFRTVICKLSSFWLKMVPLVLFEPFLTQLWYCFKRFLCFVFCFLFFVFCFVLFNKKTDVLNRTSGILLGSPYSNRKIFDQAWRQCERCRVWHPTFHCRWKKFGFSRVSCWEWSRR